MNKVILIGRLTKEPDVREKVARFTLAVDRRNRQEGAEQTADFVPCAAFGKTSEFVSNYLHQGTKIAITGRIITGSYTNRDGQRVYTTNVAVDEVEFAESKKTDSQPSQNATQRTQNRTSRTNPSDDAFVNIPDGIDDDLPFA